ncbi:1722_t:CDS:2 [Entrophospora sp. SA101]|nr:1722_t:CDS:2 [Entrophospora sp. SA101]
MAAHEEKIKQGVERATTKAMAKTTAIADPPAIIPIPTLLSPVSVGVLVTDEILEVVVLVVVLAIVPLLLVAEALFIGVIDVNNLDGDGDSDNVDAV